MLNSTLSSEVYDKFIKKTWEIKTLTATKLRGHTSAFPVLIVGNTVFSTQQNQGLCK
jgi:hypothetical protein